MRKTTKDVRSIEHTETKDNKTLVYSFIVNGGSVTDLKCEARGQEGELGYFKHKEGKTLPDTTFVNMPASGELQTHVKQQFDQILTEFHNPQPADTPAPDTP